MNITSTLKTAKIEYLVPVLLFFAIFLTGCSKERFTLTNNIGQTFELKEEVIGDGITMGSIYSTRSFNAFTDLIHYKNKWILVFREGTDHAGGVNGRLKLVTSTDGRIWKVEKVYSSAVDDLRDPKFLLDSASNELLITCFGLKYVQGNKVYSNYIIRYDEFPGSNTLTHIRTDREDKFSYILWRYAQWNVTNYCMAYAFDHNNSDTSRRLYLFRSNSRGKFETLTELKLRGLPSECTIKFNGERMYVAIRAEYRNAYIGYALPPYNQFTWLRDEEVPALAAPDFLFHKSSLLVSGRDLWDKKFKFFSYDLETGKVSNRFTFPGGYEVGYSGMCYNPANKNELWLSYYSIDEGQGSNIYLAKIDLEKLK